MKISDIISEDIEINDTYINRAGYFFMFSNPHFFDRQKQGVYDPKRTFTAEEVLQVLEKVPQVKREIKNLYNIEHGAKFAVYDKSTGVKVAFRILGDIKNRRFVVTTAVKDTRVDKYGGQWPTYEVD
jgi:hypothetical protein